MTKRIPCMFSLEGIDGAGKSTQCPRIKTALESLGMRVALLKSPSTSALGEFLRANIPILDPWLRNQLFVLDIQDSLRQLGVSSGKSVILWDRYVDSFFVSNKEMTLGEARKLTSFLPLPMRTFWLDIDPAVIFSGRSSAINHHSDPEWLALKAERYQVLMRQAAGRFVRIDANRSADNVTCDIVDAILAIVKDGG